MNWRNISLKRIDVRELLIAACLLALVFVAQRAQLPILSIGIVLGVATLIIIPVEVLARRYAERLHARNNLVRHDWLVSGQAEAEIEEQRDEVAALRDEADALLRRAGNLPQSRERQRLFDDIRRQRNKTEQMLRTFKPRLVEIRQLKAEVIVSDNELTFYTAELKRLRSQMSLSYQARQQVRELAESFRQTEQQLKATM